MTQMAIQPVALTIPDSAPCILCGLVGTPKVIGYVRLVPVIICADAVYCRSVLLAQIASPQLGRHLRYVDQAKRRVALESR